MTDISDLDLDWDDTVPIRDGVPYMAEGLTVLKIESDRWGDEMVVAGNRHACRSFHDWTKVPEGAESYVCWNFETSLREVSTVQRLAEQVSNCDAVKFPVEVLLADG